MKFFISQDVRKNSLLRLIIVFTLIFFLLLWATNLLLYLKVGFSYDSVVSYYLGSEQGFRPPKSYLGLLEEAHFHLFSMAIILVTLTHLLLFANVNSALKFGLILVSYLSALGDIAGGWLVRYASPSFAYLKIGSAVALQASLLLLIIIVWWFLYTKNNEHDMK